VVGKDSGPSVKRRILILGSKGRLGAALARAWAERHQVQTLARPEIDLTDLAGLRSVLERTDFEILVNAAASTNVDVCETAREEAHTVNTLAPGLMGEVAAGKKARLIHISTDYVFDGEKTAPYVEEDAARPLSHYGETKLGGENLALAAAPQHVAARVSWVFGPDKPSFVDMILDRARTNDQVAAIADKTSCPTYAVDTAEWLEAFFDASRTGGLYHACNSGVCTWRDYGQEALDIAARLGVPLRARQVDPIPLASMTNFVARRPIHTAMETSRLAQVTGKTPRPWQEALEDYLRDKLS